MTEAETQAFAIYEEICATGKDRPYSANSVTEMMQQTAIVALRADILTRVLPLTPIVDRCKIVKGVLEVRGQLGTYRIFLNWGIAMFLTESKPRWLRIPQKVLNAVELGLQELPLDLDHRTEMILRKAYVLANDWNISSPDLVKQLMPK